MNYTWYGLFQYKTLVKVIYWCGNPTIYDFDISFDRRKEDTFSIHPVDITIKAE